MSAITRQDRKELNAIKRQTPNVLQWWYEFACNIETQGWISKKQRLKLKSYDYNIEMNKAYSYGFRPDKKLKWATGLDHHDIRMFTGE